ncbi:hypothetical protein QBC46DRAFT_395430 [Diplogelasinospora grovesii]|uniref:Uncharacterized protein n=1 Tax=Diplogelasinospora grovesii TaxID=303347 RepID=A0AAN6S0U8_9PEZI|nr:hypothetical protein QBC46DRAFT_395430 [Diplogelasinospora grovesii]
MSRYTSYSDDDSGVDEVNIRYERGGPIRRHGPPPPPPPPRTGPQFVQMIRPVGGPRPTVGYHHDHRDAFLGPERTVISTHSRSKSRERRSSPPTGQVAPVVIHNNIVNAEHSDHGGSDYSSDESSRVSRRHGRQQRRPHSRVGAGHSHSGIRSRSRSSSSHSYLEDARDKWELERAREQLQALQIANRRKDDERRVETHYKEEAELRRAKEDLERIRRQEEEGKRSKRYQEEAELVRAKEELMRIKREEDYKKEQERIRRDIELKQLEEEKKRQEEEEARKKAAEEAIAQYKAKEAERLEKERIEKERADKEYQRRLQEDLIHAGLDEKDIAAIMKKEKIKQREKREKEEEEAKDRPTYTRMSLKHLDIATLVEHKIEWEYDTDPNFILIKRWVPEWEQNMLWEHTRRYRLVEKKREEKVVLEIDDKRHRKHGEPQFEWVRKKERRRSKSPGLLMYLAGGRPS